MLYYIKLDDSVQDRYMAIFGKSATKEMLTHLRRELIQSVWAIILDDEFMNAYAHGIPLQLSDGIVRCVFPRIFTYSADYPEKYVFMLSIIMLLISQLGFFSLVSNSWGNIHAHGVWLRRTKFLTWVTK